MTVRAKFVVDKVSVTRYGTEIEMSPVSGNSADNASFFRYTPNGSLKMGIVNPEVADEFVPGKEFYLDFTAA